MIIKTKLTKRETCKKVVELIRNYCLGNTMDQTIGLNKYTYYRVIQEYYNGWYDADYHETDSSYFPKDWKAYRTNLKAYRENSQAQIRVVNRKELNK
jgi:hypothetical protein